MFKFIYNRQMNQENRRRASVTREVLRQIINQPPTTCTQRNSHSIEAIKLNEAVAFLERKVERQYSEIKLISEQLSKQISLKEQLANMMAEERNKTAKVSQHLNNANRANVELKKQITVLQRSDRGQKTARDDFEIKMSKYRDLVRKKDELLTKNQQKLDQLLKGQRNSIKLEQQFRSIKQSLSKSKRREEVLLSQIQTLKRRNCQLQEDIKQKEGNFKEKQEALMFAEESIRRLKIEVSEIGEEYTYEVATLKMSNVQLKGMIQSMKKELLVKEQKVFCEHKPQWSECVFRNQMKRILCATVKDLNLRRKIEKGILQLFEEMQNSFNSVISQITQN